jgi:RNA polymerase sigma factor (sigma-70 family)
MVLASIVRNHYRRWLKFVVGVIGDPSDAEDVLQEAVQRVLLRNRIFPSEEEARMYLGRAICNTAIELYHRRKRQRRSQIPLREHSFPLAGADNPQLDLEKREKTKERERMLRLLDQGLLQLPAKQYEALRLTILKNDGLSMRQASLANGIPYSTLRHRSRQGIRQLRRYLRQSAFSTAPESPTPGRSLNR